MRKVVGKKEVHCKICSNKFLVWKYRVNAKCCSEVCYREYQKSPEYKKALSKKHLGKIITEETRRKISDAQKGKRTGAQNHLWKGGEVGYRAMHDWIRREKGNPDSCEHCGKGKRDGKRLVWANKSHTYLRDINDWMRLCYVCHRKYDFPNEKHL